MKKSIKKSYLINFLISILVFIAIYAAFSLNLINTYHQGLVLLVCINCIMAVSLNLATGLLGELCLGHAGFMAIGAYTAALFTMHSGLNGVPALLIGCILAAITTAFSAALVGLPALRLRGDYLAIITLAFGEIISILLRSFKFTGGALGLNGIELSTNITVCFWILIICIYIIYALIRSRHGRAILAIREDDIAAEASGINLTRYKMLAFIISATFAGIAGALFAHYQGTLSPEKFNYNYSIDFMVMVVFGGMGSITGSILAASILTILPETLRGFSEYRMLIYAVLLILLMIFKPSGLLGQKELSQRFFLNLKRKFKEPEKTATIHNIPKGSDIILSPEEKENLRKYGEKFLTEQGDDFAGVGGSSIEPRENIPLPGTPLAESNSDRRKGSDKENLKHNPPPKKPSGRR